jgi:hypothetical protein
VSIWQWTDGLIVPGIAGGVDGDLAPEGELERLGIPPDPRRAALRDELNGLWAAEDRLRAVADEVDRRVVRIKELYEVPP